jgi:hypothetical protein
MATSIIDRIKIWASPVIVSILGMMIWADVTEMKRDIKRLLEVSSSQQARIESLEKDLSLIKGNYFRSASNETEDTEHRLPFFIPFAKHEESCDLEKLVQKAKI